MRHLPRSFLLVWLPLLLLGLSVFLIQTHLFIHKDIAMLLHETNLLLQGQNYGHEIYEPNPPMILLLYTPVVWFVKMTAWNLLYVFRFYIILLCMISSILSYPLIQRIFSNYFLELFIFYAVLFTLFILPAHQFGQREHLLMIFIFPYLWAASLRLMQQKISSHLALFIGLLAGIGFSLKPHFLTALVLIELYFCFRKKSLWGWFRVESFTILAFLVGYLSVVFLFFKTYLTIVLPMWQPFYTVLAHPISYVLPTPLFIFSAAALVFYLFIKKIDRYTDASHVFLLATLGFMITFLIPRVIWYYHIVPAATTACIVFAIILGQMLTESFGRNREEIAFVSLLSAFFFLIPGIIAMLLLWNAVSFYYQNNMWNQLIQFFKNQPSTVTYDFFSNTHELLILEDYTHARDINRFPSLFWNYDYALLRFKPSPKAVQYYNHYFPFFLNAVIQDIQSKKPTFIIVDLYSEKPENFGVTFDYIKQLSQIKTFRTLWHSYHYVKTIGKFDIYQLNIL